jgi:hypothetical protein
MLSTELKNKMKDKPEDELAKKKKMKIDPSKLTVGQKKDEFIYDPK